MHPQCTPQLDQAGLPGKISQLKTIILIGRSLWWQEKLENKRHDEIFGAKL
jgi:hypothetical protein